MLTHLRPAFSLVVLFTLLLGLVFPLGFVGVGAVVFPFQANGSLIVRDGKQVGSALIGENFTSDRFFHGRESAISGTDPKDASKTVPTPYDASTSTASNLAPTSKALHDRVAGDVATLVKQGATAGAIPMDSVTSSGSGLDPDISPDYAALQAPVVAAARHVPVEMVRQLLAAHTQGRMLGVFGEPRVNVLRLNLALESLSRSGAAPGGANKVQTSSN
ncbi:potassium-transporting ATPase subunit KdpC (plasmid) [Lichenicola cladoniae]|uniref:Potassium-transporting ATPase KdpC subunit n=1 Tax=Lichenicola cladoniae TaxID=1484109 RepID=A0A6M8I0Q4_9PROT|nr:potassium-transporting ATPase subunit KdpC [Lichenicola cladoniae]NPD70067.1 potassium-transporting ATPase subunit KdpC [Acetobacteraceae bacterium]QKE93855.1 potassium-transporting ATPase subunit KdpC [Lichenicola cladoniae]